MEVYMNHINSSELVIISASRGGNLHNEVNTAKLKEMLGNFGMRYKEVEGVYKGEGEVSLLVVVSNPRDLQLFDSIANKFRQECWMYISKSRECYLVYPSVSYTKFVGRLREVSERTATGMDSYTKVGDRYFIAS